MKGNGQRNVCFLQQETRSFSILTPHKYLRTGSGITNNLDEDWVLTLLGFQIKNKLVIVGKGFKGEILSHYD